MRTTIDAAGRVVVPKTVREEMGLTAGRAIDVVYVDGRIEIALAPLDVDVEVADGLPLLRPRDGVPPLTDDIVRGAIDAVRR